MTLLIVGLCWVEVNPFGPVHDQVAPVIVSAINCKVVPVQTGLLLDALGVGGALFTATKVVPVELEQPFTVTTSE